MKLQDRYTMHTDPGHGWLEVPAAEVDYMRVPVSGYSYRSRDGGTLYLEEDCDAPAFLAFRLAFADCDPALLENGLIGPLTIKSSNAPRSDSFVRSLPGIAPRNGWRSGVWGAAVCELARRRFAEACAAGLWPQVQP